MTEITNLQQFLGPHRTLTVDERIAQLRQQGIEVTKISRQNPLSGLEACVHGKVLKRYLRDGLEYIAGKPRHADSPNPELSFEILRFRPLEVHGYSVTVPSDVLRQYESFKKAHPIS